MQKRHRTWLNSTREPVSHYQLVPGSCSRGLQRCSLSPVYGLATVKRSEAMMWMFCTWAGNFALCYMVSLRFLSRDTVLVAYWRGTFPPQTPSQIVPWVIYSFFTALENPAPLNALLGASLFVAGLGQLLRERKRSLGFLIAPLIVLFLASLLNHYPLYGRLLLFACPILLLVVSEGAVWVYNTSRRLSPILGIVFLALLLAKPMYRAAAGLIQPTRPDDIKGAIQYIQTRRRPADV